MNPFRGNPIWMGSAFAASAVLFAAGFWPSQIWVGLAVPLLAAAVWFLLRKWDLFWASSLAFLGILMGAGVGLWMKMNPFLLIASVTVSLAAWDLALFPQELPHPQVSRHPVSQEPVNAGESHGTRRRLNRHFFWLAIALGLGFLLAAFGLVLHLRLPFGVVVILALAAFISLVMAALRIVGKPE